jgi:hypothetical protein
MVAKEGNGARKFLIGLAIAIAVPTICQTCAFFFWAGAITVRVDRNERDIAAVGDRVRALETRK